MDLVAVVEAQSNVTISSGWIDSTFDGRKLNPYEIVFLGAQTNAAQNGPYVAHPSGILLPALSAADGSDTVEIKGGTQAGKRWQPIGGV